ncbi:MAG: Domain often clustered or fused with uracil-DNA glycosylase / Uracil-DNA glycosylase, putative family 6 [uncultured Lysobacter sp.]|uniref:Type-4 uracil-DNA glycosylase n=1 Tax=uncultured Lysobacter sp. TaxID=271060 RepID=A0A6J4LLJ3_9GAMM|nr:MAG: Domain often clustered or fused with uracil-DNA glycosylase / Uracil-DNA glycosylase, putative family 6 [uncultured Lysobacter sp.]
MATRKAAFKRPAVRHEVPEGSAPEPADDSLEALREAAKGCKRCDLWRIGTQTVFGEGPAKARIMVVGEQPGDQEDLAGRPFVGPSGRLFDQALEELGVDRRQVYVTNAVKHFKFTPRGKVRLHQSPNPAEQRACRYWLDGERERLHPEVIVCLGAIASKAVFGSKFGLMRQRGEWQALPDGGKGFATVHPSWVLRQRGSEERERAFRGFVADLALLTELDA